MNKPEGFEYCVVCYRDQPGTFYTDVSKNYADDFIGNNFRPSDSTGVVFVPGVNKIQKKDVFVQYDDDKFTFWFRNRTEANEINAEMRRLALFNEFKVENPVYKLRRGQWSLIDNFEARGEEDLIGHHHEIDLVVHDTKNALEREELLKKIGESHKSLNYVLYGPPGTGKTTFVKAIATKLRLPIYIVNTFTLGQNIDIDSVLNPKRNRDCILLFEDFDRYLQEEKFNMSELLNGLDGVLTTRGCIRFFTANDIAIFNKTKALINRMVGKFHFNYPAREDFVNKFERFLALKTERPNQKQLDKFIAKVAAVKDLTLRPFTNYVIRYFFQPNYMELLLNKFHELNEDNSVPVKAPQRTETIPSITEFWQ